MAPKGKGQPKGKSFMWDLETTKILLNICLDYQKAKGVDKPFSWVKISEELAQKIGKECCCMSVKNKFDHMKKLWRLWKKLWQNETCIAWNPVEGSIDADDAWWDRKIKENEKYKQFRKKGVPLEIDELCKQIFRTEHGGAPSRDPLEAEADGSETETEAQSQSKADGGETEAQSQSKADGGETETEAQSQSKADGGKTEAQINRMLQQANRILLYRETWHHIFSSSSIRKPGSYNFVDNSIVDHYPKVDESETQVPTQLTTVQSQSEADGGEAEAGCQKKRMLQQDIRPTEYCNFLENPIINSKPEVDGGPTQSNTLQYQSDEAEKGETEAQKHRMLQQDIRSTEFGNFLAIYSEPEVDGGPTRSNTVQSQSEAEKGETEAQKHRMLQQDIRTTEFGNFLAIYSEPEVDGGPTQSNTLQYQSDEAEKGETEAQKHRMLQLDKRAPELRNFLANPIINWEPEVDGGPIRSNTVQSQSEADGGETEAQKHGMLQQDMRTTEFHDFLANSIINREPKVDGVQSQSEADGGEAEVQSQSNVDGIETDAQSQPEAEYFAMGSSPSFQDQLLPTRSPVLAKRKRNESTGAAIYNPNPALIDGANLKMVSSLSGDVSILEAAAAPKEKYTYDDAMSVIERLLKVGSLVEGSPLWCFGVNEMLKDDVRRLFLTIPRDSGRLAWLQWRFQLAHPEMHHK